MFTVSLAIVLAFFVVFGGTFFSREVGGRSIHPLIFAWMFLVPAILFAAYSPWRAVGRFFQPVVFGLAFIAAFAVGLMLHSVYVKHRLKAKQGEFSAVFQNAAP